MKKIIIILVVILILTILIVLNKNRIFHKRIYMSLENNLNNKRQLSLRNEKFSENNSGCTEIDPNIYYTSFTPKSNTYFCMIPNIQPFNYYDSVKMVVESKDYIFLLNESMTQVMRVDKTTFNFENISDSMFQEKKQDNTLIFIPIISACYDTNQCFAYIKKYTIPDEITDTNAELNFKGEILILEKNYCIDFIEEFENGGNKFILDLVDKFIVEGKIVDNKGEYSIYIIKRELLNNHIYKSELYHFYGGDNKYYGEVTYNNNQTSLIKNFIPINRKIGNIDSIDFSSVNTDEITELKINETLNIKNIYDVFNELEFAVNNKDYLYIFRFGNDYKYATEKYFANYINKDIYPFHKNIKQIYTEIIQDTDLQNSTEDAFNDDGTANAPSGENQNTFEDKLDTIRKNKILEFGKECLKILNKYLNLLINYGINLGVNHFNINEERLILQTSVLDITNSNVTFKYVKLDKAILENEEELNFFEGKNIYLEEKNDKENAGYVEEEKTSNVIIDFTKNTKYKDYQEQIDQFKIFENNKLFIKESQNFLFREKNKDNDNFNFSSNVILTTDNAFTYVNKKFKYFYTYKDFDYEITNYSKYLKIKNGSYTGKQNIFGVLDVKDDIHEIKEVDKKHIFHKRPIFFMLFAEPSQTDIDNNYKLEKKKSDNGIVYVSYLNFLFLE